MSHDRYVKGSVGPDSHIIINIKCADRMTSAVTGLNLNFAGALINTTEVGSDLDEHARIE